MDLMTLAAKLTLDDSGFRSGLNSAESMGERFAGKMSAMTVAAGQIIANLAQKSFSAVTGMISGAVDAVADYEQLIGGVETLFKGSADTVANYAKNSFKTTGLSANAYMETVTGFSASLLQGLKGDTEEAAELANVAVTDMADNANKMGTDLSSIQTAYQGFAKQNYTMLDNLKLGYGGTKEEMVRLINDSGILNEKIEDLDGITFDQIIQAIHKIQEEMGITGTTAEEAAQTISGSKASLKAAWEDLLSAVGGEGGQARLDETLENFKTAFSTYMENFIPTLTTTILNSGSLVEAIAGAISDLPTTLLSDLGKAGLEAGTDMVSSLGTLTHWLIESITNLFREASADPSSIQDFGTALGEFLGTAISDIVTNAPTIVAGIFNMGVALAGNFIEGLFSGLFGLGNEVDGITDELNKNLFAADKQSTEASAILDYMEKLVGKYGEGVKETEEWKTAEDELENIMGGSKEVFEQYGNNVDGAVQHLKEMNEELRKAAVMNALEKATSDEMELLTTQTLGYNKEKARYDRNASMQDTYMQNMRDDILKYAAASAEEYWNSTHDESGRETDFFDETYYSDLKLISEGLSRAGDELKPLAELDFSQLESIASFIGDDELLNSVKADIELYKKSGEEMKAAKAEMEASEKEIEATKEAIANTKAAMDQTVIDLLGSGAKAGTSIESGGSTVHSALIDAATKIRNVQISSPRFGGGANTFMPRAVGIDYAPYDGFRTELHRGEAIITKEENAKRMEGMDQDAMEAALTDAIERSMSRIYINMDGNRVGDLTTRRTQSNISGNERSRIRAMGG